MLVAVDQQSPDIGQGVDTGGAGDQGMMFGYACDETPELMPAPIQYAHAVTRQLAKARRAGSTSSAPTARARSPSSTEDGKVARIDAVVVSTQHAEDVSNKKLHEAIREEVIAKALPKKLLDKKTKIFINPTGRFVIGGPMGDTGVTGRKIIVDTYGGMGRHGGGAFSGKDPVEGRSLRRVHGRYIAKNVVAAGLAKPLRGAGGLRDRRRRAGLGDGRHVRHRRPRGADPGGPRGVRPHPEADHRGARPPPAHLQSTAAYGHFGRTEKAFTWERTDRRRRGSARAAGREGPRGRRRPGAPQPRRCRDTRPCSREGEAGLRTLGGPRGPGSAGTRLDRPAAAALEGRRDGRRS